MVCFLLHKSFDFTGGMGITNVLWSGFSVLFVIFAGIFFFHEKIQTYDIVGITLIVLGICCIRYTK